MFRYSLPPLAIAVVLFCTGTSASSGPPNQKAELPPVEYLAARPFRSRSTTAAVKAAASKTPTAPHNLPPSQKKVTDRAAFKQPFMEAVEQAQINEQATAKQAAAERRSWNYYYFNEQATPKQAGAERPRAPVRLRGVDLHGLFNDVNRLKDLPPQKGESETAIHHDYAPGNEPSAQPMADPANFDHEMEGLFQSMSAEPLPPLPSMPAQYPQMNQGSFNNIQTFQQMLNAWRMA